MIGSTNLSGGGGVSSDELTANAAQVLSGYTYVGVDTNDEQGTGTMTNNGTVTYSLPINGTYSLSGYYNSGSKITQSITTKAAATYTPNTSTQTIAAGQYLSGAQTIASLGGNAPLTGVLNSYTFSSDAVGRAKTGTMANYSTKTSTSNYTASTFRSATTGYVFASPGATGYYSTSSYLRIPASNLSAANIKKGVSIMGITGTYEGFVTSPTTILEEWNVDNTGGMSSNSGSVDIRENSQRYFLSLQSTTSLYVRVNNAINVTDYRYLKATGNVSKYNNSWPQCSMSISTNPNYSGYTATSSQFASSTTSSTIICNITNLTGMYYIYFYLNGVFYSSATIEEIILSNS